MSGSDSERLVAEWQQLVNAETALQGLLHWHERMVEEWQKGMLNAPRAIWYYGAFLHHADAIFNSTRAGTKQLGSVLRALQDLGYADIAEGLESPLTAPHADGGPTLRTVITRMRNEMLVHTNLSMAELGPLFVVIGSREDDYYAERIDTLMEAARTALTRIGEAKHARVLGLPANSTDLMDTMARRARERERERRKAESLASRRDKGP